MTSAIAALTIQTVTFAAPADSAQRLLPRLGVAAGLRLEADSRAGAQVLLIRIRNMKVNRLLSLISETTGGEWTAVQGGYRLTLDNARLRTLRREEAKRREAWIATRIKMVSGPLGQALASVGAGTLANLAQGERLVWSSRPSPLQKMLRDGDALGRSVLTIETQRLRELRRDQPGLEGVDEAIESDPGLTLLAARRGLDARSLGIGLTIFSKDDLRIKQIAEILEPPLPSLPTLPPDHAKSAVAIPLDFHLWTIARRPGDLDAKTRESVTARLRQPQTYEPLGFGAGPIIEGIAGQLALDVVAALPDQAFDTARRSVSQSLDLQGWLRAFLKDGMTIRLDEGAMILRASDLAHSAERRANRGAIRRRIASLETHGSLPLDFPAAPGLTDAYLETLPTHTWSDEQERLGTQRSAEAWLSLTPVQRQMALNGGVELPIWAPFFRHVRELLSHPEQPGEERTGMSVYLEPTVLLSANSGTLRATLESWPGAVYQSTGDPFPCSVPELGSVAHSLKTLPLRQELREASYWPATHRALSLRVGIGSITIQLRSEETVRNAGAGYRYPNLFPELRRALGAGGG